MIDSLPDAHWYDLSLSNALYSERLDGKQLQSIIESALASFREKQVTNWQGPKNAC